MRSTPKTASSSPRRNLSLSLAAAVAMVLGGQSANADTLTWNGSNGSWDMSNLNWQSQSAPATNVAWTNSPLNSAVFSSVGTVGTVTVNAPITVGNITFNTAGYTIAGSTLTLSNTTIDGTANATISANLGGTGLTVTNSGATATSRTVTLSGDNTYSGTTTITGSSASTGSQILRLDSANALGGSNQITVENGSGLLIGQNMTTGLGKILAIAGSGVSNQGALYLASGKTATWEGDVVLNPNARVSTEGGATLTLSGIIGNGTGNGSGNLNISAGAFVGNSLGTVMISGVKNTYSGATNIIRGTLKIGATNALPTGTKLDVDSSSADQDSTFDLNGFYQTVGGLYRTNASGDTGPGLGGSFVTNNGTPSATITINSSVTVPKDIPNYSGIIQDGTGSLAVTKTGTGSQILSGANTYGGLTTVTANGGSLVVNHANALGSTSAGTTVLSGGSLAVGNGITTNADENVTISGAGQTYGALTTYYYSDPQNPVPWNTATWQGSVTLGDGNARVGAKAGTSLNISGAILGSSPSSQTLFISGESGTGTVIISAQAGSNKYSGPTNVIRGILKIGADNSLPTGTTLDVGQSTAPDQSTFDLNGFNQTIGALKHSGDATGGNAIVTNSATGPVKTLTVNQSSNTTFGDSTNTTGSITGNLALKKTGAGKLTLSGTNTYTGATEVSGGTLAVSNSISGSSSVAVNNSGSLILGGAASNRIADTAPVTLGNNGASGTPMFSIDNSATTSLGSPFQETVGKLTLASNAILDLGVGNAGTILHFADSSLDNPWTGTLKIYNWSSGTDQLFFGSSLSGLTSAQLSQVLFYSDAGTNSLGSGMMLSSGEMVPVPEPSTLLGGAALLGFLGWRERSKIGRVLSLKF